MEKKPIKIAIVGLPNVGKTTFLNTLTNSNLKTANFAGSTIKKHEVGFFYKGITFFFVDLPGFNSFIEETNDLAKSTIKFLKEGNYDAVLHIANAEFPYFSSILDKEIKKEVNAKIITAVNFPSYFKKTKHIEEAFEKAILFSSLSLANCTKILDTIIAEMSGEIYKSDNLLTIKDAIDSKKITKLIDKIALSKILGLPLFFLIMFAIFWLSFVLGKGVGDFFVSGFEFVSTVTEDSIYLSSFIKALLVSILAGVGVLIGFMPTIIICTSLIALLEQTGYITRVCFLLDKLFEKFGLGGKSLIPLIVGAGCSITAYMSARMINDPREKFLTMVIIGFVPCTAKLAVFILFSLALFGDNAPIAIFAIYLFGFVFGLLCAKFLGLFIKQDGSSQKTKIEIFNYRLPIFKNVFKTGYDRTKDYIKNAATVITLFASAISFFSLIGFVDGAFVVLSAGELSQSLIGKLGQILEPLFAPMHFDFRMIISLITGLIAKETAIATLAVLYSSSTQDLVSVISSEIAFKQAVAYLAFMFFYLPCISATVSFYREVQSLKKTLFLVFFTLFLAYFASLSVYHLF
jgi:ferrous iron transport protein B